MQKTIDGFKIEKGKSAWIACLKMHGYEPKLITMSDPVNHLPCYMLQSNCQSECDRLNKIQAMTLNRQQIGRYMSKQSVGRNKYSDL